MKYLGYGIVRAAGPFQDRLPAGPEGIPVCLLVENGLAAAFSQVADTYATPAVPHLVEYARVVAALHALDTVLPLRYGCLLDSEAQLRDFLRRRHQVFQTALQELAGCEEMGIRVLPAADFRDTTAGPPTPAEAVNQAVSPGIAYLTARQATYTAKERRLACATALLEQARTAFSGLYLRCTAEQNAALGPSLLSVHFLLRREHLAAFRQAFERWQHSTPDRMLLTGPWPPYNFVSSEP